MGDYKVSFLSSLGSSEKMFTKFAFLLNEDKNPCRQQLDDEIEENFLEKLIKMESNNAELQITRLGKLLAEKIHTHSGLHAEIFNPKEILSNSSTTLAPVMYRIAVEGFVRVSNATFKIIECRHVTKLSSDWQPSLPDLLINRGHQVIIVDLKDEHAAYYNDFSYSILRQIKFDWKERLPLSFFHPDDVCSVVSLPDRHLMTISPTLPDGELEFSQVKSKLEHNLLSMLKNSCLSAMQNHLLLRDLRVGKLGDAMDGFECIRRIYRELQRRIRAGEKVILGTRSEQLNLYMSTNAGLTISSTESILNACKMLDSDGDLEKLTIDITQNGNNVQDNDKLLEELNAPISIDKWQESQLKSQQSSGTNLKMK